MRSITEIIIHCTATPAGRHVSVAEIALWHRQRGFRSIGYHYLLDIDGTIHTGRPLSETCAHCLGHNS
ncbi:MAG: N-acetylmuramoyl-L-alanine amidase, partial [Duncaniella sp.]|nr:N-acetylmuramoyl-L-alanine amidase [Duncaniella sp.]